jgi:hypothetical protein
MVDGVCWDNGCGDRIVAESITKSILNPSHLSKAAVSKDAARNQFLWIQVSMLPLLLK